VAGAAPLAARALELERDGALEGLHHRGEALGLALERSEGERYRLEGGEVDGARLAPEVPVAAGAPGVDGESGQGGEGRTKPEDLLRLGPGPVDGEEDPRRVPGEGPGRDRALSREEEGGGGPEVGAERALEIEGDASVDLGIL